MSILRFLSMCAAATFSALGQEQVANPLREIGGVAVDAASYGMYLNGNSDEDSILASYLRKKPANEMGLVSASNSTCDSSDSSCL